MPRKPLAIKALVFDVFGTVVDWRSSLIREGTSLGRRKRLRVDWAAFADAWRAGYQPAMARVRSGELPWTRIDDLHRMILEDLLKQFSIRGLTEPEIDHFNRAWHRLRPWPDARRGLALLKRDRVIATLSNGNVALLTNMAKHGGLPWDCVLSAELFGKYKPDPAVYQGAARLLGVERDALLMVAAHPSDLVAAQRAGLRTAYVPRPLEWGPDGYREPVGSARFDVTAADFVELAAKLGA